MSEEPSDLQSFERPALTVDVVIFALIDDQLQVLLVRRKHAPYAGQWALPGGFVRMDEALAVAAARQLEEKTGARDVYLEQLYTFGDLERDPRTRVVTVTYFALVPASAIEHRPGERITETRWWPATDHPPLAFDHQDILDYAITRLQYKLEYTMVGFELLPDEFTLSDLQQAYEIILGEKLDKRNFRRKILSADILEETGRKRREGEGRPAALYRYRTDAVAEVKTRRLFP
jgi:8-oxo-dGTP diphosphatase